MRRDKIRSILPFIAIAMVFIVTAGTAFAYFSDYEEALGGATLQMQSETELDEGDSNTDKHIVIENTGETDMVVRVQVFGTELAGKTVMDVSSESKSWTENADGFWYYSKVLAPGEKTEELYGRLTAEGTDLPENFDITVVHESAPAVYNADSTLKLPEGWNGPENIRAEIIPAQ